MTSMRLDPGPSHEQRLAALCDATATALRACRQDLEESPTGLAPAFCSVEAVLLGALERVSGLRDEWRLASRR